MSDKKEEEVKPEIPLKISIREKTQSAESLVRESGSPFEKDRFSMLTVSDPTIKKKLSNDFIKEIYNDTYKIGNKKIDKRVIDHFFRIVVVVSILGFSFYKIVTKSPTDNNEVWVGMISSIFGYSISLAPTRSSQQQKKE